MSTPTIDRLSRKLRPALAWALFLALLPPIACSGAAEPGAPVAAAVQGDLVSRLPAIATTIGYVNFASLRNSAAYDFAQQEGAKLGIDELEDMIERTGIDPRTDVHAAAFAAGSLRDLREDGGVGVVVVADFDRARLEESLAKLPSREVAGHSVRVLGSWNREDGDEPHDGDGDGDGEHAEGGDEDSGGEHAEENGASDEATGVVTILDDSTLAFGTEAMVQAILEVSDGAGSARTNDALMALLEDVDTDSEIWAISLQDQLFDSMAPAQGMPQIPVDRIKAMIVSMRLSDGITLQLRGRTEREEDAKLLGDSLNGMLAFGKMMLQSNTPEIFEIFDRGIRAGSSGRDVTIRAELTVEDMETLRDFAVTTMGSAGEGIGG